MPSKARKRFDENAGDIDLLIDLYQGTVELYKDDKAVVEKVYEVLFRSAIVLMVSHWEAYIEDICSEALEHLMTHVTEFRVAPPTDKATAVNIHLLVSPDDPQHEREIMNALARLDWAYGGRKYSCLPEQLMALGRAFDSKIKEDGPALRVGVTQFKVDFNRFREWYHAEPWIRRNALVGVAAGADGVSGFRRDGSWAALRDEITRFSQIMFSGRPGEREFWLGMGSLEDRDVVSRLGGPKPCVHGSDAHEIAKLFRPDNDRFCWIKADLTFEGLRQVLHEPCDRIYIGPTPPIYHDQARVIRAVKLSNGRGWFDDISIPLNPGLVSIIGQKGSGKSALAELISFAAGSWHPDGAGMARCRALATPRDRFSPQPGIRATQNRSGSRWKGFLKNFVSPNFLHAIIYDLMLRF